MTTDEALCAMEEQREVAYEGAVWLIGHIITYIERGNGGGKRNALYLIPKNGSNSVTYARMRDCSLKGECDELFNTTS